MAKFENGSLVTVIDVGQMYYAWKSRMIKEGFPSYITDLKYVDQYYRDEDIKEYLYKVVSSDVHTAGSHDDMVYHLESLITSHIIKTDQPCHLLIGDEGITKYE